MNPRDQNRRDRQILLFIVAVSGLVIAIVLYFAGAFMRSTG